MREVAIIGIGQIPVAEHWDKSLRQLAGEAILNAMQDARIQTADALYVANSYGGTVSGQSQLGALIAGYSGLNGIESYTIEAGDASGGAALRAAYLAIASGMVETAIVVGVEKLTDAIAEQRVLARNVSLDADYEAAHGVTLTALAGLAMQRYLYEFGLDVSAFEGFSINAHANGSKNPLAMYRNKLKAGSFAKAPLVSSPVNLFDSAPDGDGAAALVLTSKERAADMVPHPIVIAGSGAATDTLALQDRTDPLTLNAVSRSTQKALTQAQLTLSDINAVELHDAYTILAALSLEAMGFAERGKGWEYAAESGKRITLSGELPLSTFGGLKSRGNPAGATGIYQAVEATLQLRGVAAENQVPNAQRILIQNIGGFGSTVVTHILRA